MKKQKLVVLTGAGISAESGINTFRDANGLWEGHNITDVASLEGWKINKNLVLDFYNKRRKQLHEVIPNSAHTDLAKLEHYFDVHIITQNVDDLHERAGSKNVYHLHGELFKVCSENNKDNVITWKKDLTINDKDASGNQLRPFIVWFGEEVPMINKAQELVKEADVLVIIGTSLQVYPAAGLLYYANSNIPIYYIDKNPATISHLPNKLTVIKDNATGGVKNLFQKITNNNA